MKRELSEKLFAEALNYIPGGVNSPVRAFRAVGGKPFFVQHAEGAYVFDVDGNDYVDYVCSWGPNILGHAAKSVVHAVKQAAEKGLSFGIPNPYEVSLAKKIIEWVPSIQKVRFCNSGTEATMSCIRLARGFTKRERIIKFEGCYHGHVDSLLVAAGSGALTLGRPDSAGVPQALAELTTVLPFNDLKLVEKVFIEQGKEIAAIILEPIPANAGLYLPRSGFLEGLRKLCSQWDALLIFDEVMTGFRLARGGAQEIYGVTPDLSAFGKVIGGGLPVGAFGGRSDIMDYLAPDGPVYQAGTLSGNPLAMAAGLAQLKELEASHGFRRLNELGSEFAESMNELLKQLGEKGKRCQFKQIGSMFCLYFCEQEIHNLTDAKRSDTKAFARFFHAMLEQGIYLAPSQFEAGFLSMAHGAKEMEKTLRAARQALEKI
ncbi:MAG: glutamate-1-semialdehyde 2,1-aminomutase [Verrucomicrobiae bacterium]|nr:glutamate-1-semialdehyde 2,1-aminomutase [Verrucomicrobiae bacterium]